MTKRLPIMMLIFMMSMVATSVAGIVIYQLYKTQYQRQEIDLLKNIHGQVDILEFIAENGDEASKKLLREFASDENILGQQQNADAAITLNRTWTQEAFGVTGRFLAGKKIGDQIYFFRLKENAALEFPVPVSWEKELQGPMGYPH